MPTNHDSTIELLTPNELADMLKISKVGVYRIIARRKMRFYKVGGSLRFDRKDVMSYLKDNQIDVIK